MKVIIPCAGYATRLYPLTLNTPKHLLPIGNKVILDHVVEQIMKLPCIDEVVLVTNARFYNQFKQWAMPHKNVRVLNDETISNEDRLGTIGDLCFVLDRLSIDDSVLIVLGDNLFEFSLPDMYEVHKQRNASIIALIDVQKSETASRFGVAEVDNSSRIIGFEEKPSNPKTCLVATGCYMLTKEDVTLAHTYHKEQKKDAIGEFIAWLSRNKSLYGWIFSGMWFDIGSHEHYEEAKRVFGKK